MNIKKIFRTSVLCICTVAVALSISACGKRKLNSSTEAWLYGNTTSGTTYISATPTPAPVAWTPAPSLAPTPTITPPPVTTPAPTVEPTPTPYLPTPTPYIEEIPTTTNLPGTVNGDEVNFRQYPTTEALILNAYNRGKEVTILGYGNGWTKVLIDGYSGYIKSEFVLAGASEVTAGDENVSVFVDPMTVSSNGSSNLSAIQERILALTNAERAGAGLSALSYDARLQNTADTRAIEQASLFSHTRPDGSDWSTAYPVSSYYFLGENLAMCDGILTDESFASSCVKWWMNSEDHRANILNSYYTVIAIGVYVSGGNMYAVQEFGTPY